MLASRVRAARAAAFESRKRPPAPAIKSVLAVALLGLGGVALVGWIVLLGWLFYRGLLLAFGS